VEHLHIAAKRGHVDLVLALVREFGVDVNQAGQLGGSPLHYAAAEGQLAVLRALGTEMGSDVSRAMDDSATPLTIAADHGHYGVMLYLVMMHVQG
jgi:ankyrin repeat protein